MKKKSRRTIGVLFIAIFLSACSSSGQLTKEPLPTSPAESATSEIIAEGRVEPIRFTDLALSTNGLITEVLVVEGDQVQAGQVIAKLENPQARTLESAQADAMQRLTEAYANVRDAQYQLDNFDVPSEFSGMTSIEAVQSTREKLNTARDNFEPYKNLSDRWLAAEQREIDTGVYRGVAKRYKKELDDAWADYRRAIQWLALESNLENAQARLTLAQQDYENLQDAAFSEDTAGLRAALANAEVRASIPGTITKQDLKVGEFVPAGKPAITIADLSSWVVKTTDLTELDVVNVREGQPVDVTLDALPGITLKGHVLSIDQSYSENQGDVVYEVTLLLTDDDPAMRWGMTAEVTFVTDGE
jgi:multidrug resistance efflux pump